MLLLYSYSTWPHMKTPSLSMLLLYSYSTWPHIRLHLSLCYFSIYTRLDLAWDSISLYTTSLFILDLTSHKTPSLSMLLLYSYSTWPHIRLHLSLYYFSIHTRLDLTWDSISLYTNSLFILDLTSHKTPSLSMLLLYSYSTWPHMRLHLSLCYFSIHTRHDLTWDSISLYATSLFILDLTSHETPSLSMLLLYSYSTWPHMRLHLSLCYFSIHIRLDLIWDSISLYAISLFILDLTSHETPSLSMLLLYSYSTWPYMRLHLSLCYFSIHTRLDLTWDSISLYATSLFILDLTSHETPSLSMLLLYSYSTWPHMRLHLSLCYFSIHTRLDLTWDSISLYATSLFILDLTSHETPSLSMLLLY